MDFQRTRAILSCMPAPPALRALIVEDDVSTAEFLRVGLAYEGYAVEVCGDGILAVRVAEQAHPHVVILDWMLPGIDGLEVCRRLRAYGDPAILMLTARDGLPDRIVGLETGADDYLVKPFHYEEVVARLRAILRRKHGQLGKVLRIADLELNPSTHDVSRGGRSIELTPREFDLLQLLLEQPRRLFSKQQIIERVWGYDFTGDDNIVEVYIGYLRDKLDDRGSQRLIRNVRGAGYAVRDD
jgi:two-component system, OmpR family, response regulator MprA